MGIALDVGEVYHEPESFGELVKSTLDAGVWQPFQNLVLCRLQPGRQVRRGAGQLQVLDVAGDR